MHLRRVIPATVFAVLIGAAPAAAATSTTAAGPSPTPLILEVALAVAVGIFLAIREPIGRALDGVRRRAASVVRATPASERARGA
jgi:hypothetical protein